MKHNSFFALGLIGLLTLAITGCNGFEEQKPNPSEKGTFVIMVTPETKTEMDESTVVWSENDQLNVFATPSGSLEYGENVVFTHESDIKFTGSLSLSGSSSNDWYVLYPYNSEITTPAGGSGAINIGCAPGGYQTQVGNGNSAHLVGPHFPLYGKVANVPSNVMPGVTLKQALSILKVHVTNKTTEPLTVNEVSFTGTEGIAGSFYINFTDSAAFTPVSASKTATLKVTDGEAIAVNGSADFYLAIKPFKATSGSTLTLAVNGYKKSIDLSSDVSFKEGKIRTLNFETPTEFPPLLEEWNETELSDIVPGDVFVLVGNGTYAVDNTLNTSSGGPVPVSIEVADTKALTGVLVNEPSDNVKWTLVGNDTDGYVFYSYVDSRYFLYCSTTAASGSNDNMRVGPTGERNRFVIEDGHLKTKDDYTPRYIGINGTSDFRGYVTSTSNSVTFKIYKKNSEPAGSYAITIDSDIIGGIVTAVPEDKQYEGSTVTLTAEPTTGIFTSWDVYKTGDSSVKVTVENDQFVMPGYPVTVSAVFGEASLTVSGTTPEKAECTDGAEVTFTVTSNVDWIATTTTNPSFVKGIYVGETQIDTAEPVEVQASADEVTVTVKMNANSGAERTAVISVTPVDQTHYSGQNKTVSVTQKLYTAPKIIDVLNNAWTGISGNSYVAVPDLGGSASDAVYSVQAAGDHASIQLRSNNSNSGIVTTTSGGLVKKISVKWNSYTAAARVLNVYGKNSAYESPSDLYVSSTQGTLLGTFTCSDGDASIDVDDEYEYVGIRSNSGALYLDEVDIEWGQAETKYAITIDGNIENGTVEASATSIAAGKTVTLTVTPDSGYQLDELTVYKTGDSSTEVTVTNNTFTMPEYAVTVTASFEAVPTMNVLKTGFSAPAAAGTYTETGVYELLNGASDDDVEAIGDGDIVTDVIWENGNLNYTVSANAGAAREGTILISYDGGEDEEITVSQAAATYQLTLTAPGDGYSITAKVGNTTIATATTSDQTADVVYGSTVSLSATAPSSYTLDEWTVTGAVLSGNQFTMTGDVTVSASFVAGKDGKDPSNPYTVAEALEVIDGYSSGQGGTDSVYVSGIVVAQGSLYNSTRLTYFISDDGTSTGQIQIFRGRYLGGADFSSVDQLSAGSTVVVYGQLYKYNTTPEVNSNNRLYSINGKTKALKLDTFTVTTDNTNNKKDITVQWGASGTSSTISYTITCAKKSDGTESQSHNATAAGNHTFSVASYDTDYTITVTATAADALSATGSVNEKVANPDAGVVTGEIYHENFGSPSGNTAIANFNGWEKGGTLSQSSVSYTYSGSTATPIRKTSPSSGYDGASGNGCLYTAAGGVFTATGINVTGTRYITISCGTQATSANTAVTYKFNTQASATSLAPTTSKTTGPNTWGLVSYTQLEVPSGATSVTLTFTIGSASRIDDIKIVASEN